MVNQKMAQDLINLGLKKNDVVLVHSSLSALGYVEGGADTVIDTLLTVLDCGTLLVPTLSFETVNKENPVFSISDTPSCVGKISEIFRMRNGVIRSIHPTHSVCGIGKYAEEILSKHIDTSTPAGSNSPFALLPEYNGKILMLGCGLRPNTSMHAVEELVYPWYLMRKEKTQFRLTDKNGTEITKDYECHNFQGVKQRYDRLADIMNIDNGKILDAQSYLIDSVKMWDVSEKALENNAQFFVDLV